MIFWPVSCVGFSSLLFKDSHSPAVVAACFGIGIFVLAVMAIRLRYLLAITLLTAWLSYVYFNHDYMAAAVQAAAVGLCLALWSLWQRWQDKIKEQPMQPPSAPA